MSFAAIRDQEPAVRLLRNILKRGRVPNGLLFWGPDGVGKRLTALETAKAVNCTAADDDACGTCLSCRKADSGNHPDLRVVAPVQRSRTIDVETIEEINGFAALRAFEGAWRVFVILDADRINLPAQNHFLKTLEEPPGQSLFILVTQYPRVLLPTIRSRCQMIRFGALRPETVRELLERERGLDAQSAATIAELAQGQMSRALDLVDTDKREVALDLVERLSQGQSPVDLAAEFNKRLQSQREAAAAQVKADLAGNVLSEEGSKEDREQLKTEQEALIDALCRRDIMEYLYLLETWCRDELVYHATQDARFVLNRDHEARLAQTSASGKAADKIAALRRARAHLERFINEERVFRDLFFALAE